MIESIGKTFVISCDKCSYSDEFDISDYSSRSEAWAEMIIYMRGEGFKIEKIGDEYFHYCQHCEEKKLTMNKE